MHHAHQAVAKTGGDPDVAMAIDGETAGVEAASEGLGFARIRCREAADVIDAAVGDPDTVLLINGQVEWRYERLARLGVIALADNPSLGQIALWEVDELPFLDPQDPDIATWSDHDALH